MKKLLPLIMCLVMTPGLASAETVLDEAVVKGISAELKQAVLDGDISVFKKYLYPGSKIVIDLDPSNSAGEVEISYADYMGLLEMSLPLMQGADISDEILSVTVDAENNQATIKEKTVVIMEMMGVKVRDESISEDDLRHRRWTDQGAFCDGPTREQRTDRLVGWRAGPPGMHRLESVSYRGNTGTPAKYGCKNSAITNITALMARPLISAANPGLSGESLGPSRRLISNISSSAHKPMPPNRIHALVVPFVSKWLTDQTKTPVNIGWPINRLIAV